VVDTAKSPANSSGKGRVLLTVAAVIGLLFGLTSAVLAEELDDRIMTPREVEVFLGVDVLGLVPRLNHRNSGRSKRPDVIRAPLMLTDDPGSLNLEAFRMLRAEVTSRLERVAGGRIIAVAGPSYGEGKSTVALNLARVLAMEDRRVLLIDGDLRRPHLKALLGRRNGMGLEEYLRGERDLRGAVQASRLPQVDVLGAQQELYRPGEEAGSERFRALLREARDLYDYTVIDAGAVNVISEVATMARQADGTLLVLHQGETRRREVRLAMRRLFGLGSRLLGAVLNGVPSRTTDCAGWSPSCLRTSSGAGDRRRAHRDRGAGAVHCAPATARATDREGSKAAHERHDHRLFEAAGGHGAAGGPTDPRRAAPGRGRGWKPSSTGWAACCPVGLGVDRRGDAVDLRAVVDRRVRAPVRGGRSADDRVVHVRALPL
jgi:capsular exopolysaccharide synthesis family protein